MNSEFYWLVGKFTIQDLTPFFLSGQTLKGNELHIAAGGKGANQAVAAARLGMRVAFIGKVGNDDRGQELTRRLSDERVDVRFVAHSSEKPTGVALIFVGTEGEKEIMWFPGANQQLTIQEIEKTKEMIQSASVFLTQLEVPMECVLKAIDLSFESGGQVVLDAAPAKQVPDECLKKITIVRANSGEAEVLTGVMVSDRLSARRAAEILLKRGAQAAIIEAGSEGNLVVWFDRSVVNESWLPRLSTKSIDTTGAGDAFSGALATLLAEGKPLPEAASFANAAAALKTTVIGAQAGLPDRESIIKILSTSPQPPPYKKAGSE